MAKSYPVRHETHQLEEISRRYFTNLMPRNWVCDRPANDYGVDLRVDLFDGRQATGLELLVQLKGSSKAIKGDFETIRLKMSTFNHLRAKLQVVMLVKYVEATNEAYWQMLRDVKLPERKQKSILARIPKASRLSQIDWDDIQEDVRQVTDTKTAAYRRSLLDHLSKTGIQNVAAMAKVIRK